MRSHVGSQPSCSVLGRVLGLVPRYAGDLPGRGLHVFAAGRTRARLEGVAEEIRAAGGDGNAIAGGRHAFGTP